MRHQLQELRQSVDVEDEDNEISTLVANDQIVAIAAEKSYIDTVWFVYVIENDTIDRDSERKDDYSHIVPQSQPFLTCQYLEKEADKKNGVVYKTSTKNVFLYKESIVYPLVEFESNCNNKENLFYLSNSNYIEILNSVQYTAMRSSF